MMMMMIMILMIDDWWRNTHRLLEDVKEMWTETAKGGKGKTRGTAVNKDRYVSKMFLRGDSVIIIVSNPVALAEQQQQHQAATATAAKEAVATTTSGSSNGEIAEKQWTGQMHEVVYI